MLRSAPALTLSAVADGVGVSSGELKRAASHLNGRGPCDELAVSSTSWLYGIPRVRSVILQSVVCPPFAARCAAWDLAGSVRNAAPGVAGWSSRNVESVAAPRVAIARAAAEPTNRYRAIQQPDTPPAIAARLRTIEPAKFALLAAEARVRRRSPTKPPRSAATSAVPLPVAAVRRVSASSPVYREP